MYVHRNLFPFLKNICISWRVERIYIMHCYKTWTFLHVPDINLTFIYFRNYICRPYVCTCRREEELIILRLKVWNDQFCSALEALRQKKISANKAAKVYKIPSSTLYKIARKEGIELAQPFNAVATTWTQVWTNSLGGRPFLLVF